MSDNERAKVARCWRRRSAGSGENCLPGVGGGSAGGSGSCGGESSRVNTHNAVTSTAIRPTLHSLLVPATDIFSLRPFVHPRVIGRPLSRSTFDRLPPRETISPTYPCPDPRDSILDWGSSEPEESLLLFDGQSKISFVEKKERKKERKKEGEKYSPSSSVWPRIGLDSGQTRRRRDAKAGSV